MNIYFYNYYLIFIIYYLLFNYYLLFIIQLLLYNYLLFIIHCVELDFLEF